MNKRIVMALMAAVITAGTFGTGTLTANAAAPKTATVKVVDNTKAKQKALAAVFDAKYYAEANPDVVKALGNDPKVLLSHYIKSGIKEGRNASATFNLDAYVSANPDLVTAFGTDDTAIAKYINHFATHATKEHRIATVEAASKMNIPVYRYGDNTTIINNAMINHRGQLGVPNTAAYSSSSYDSSSYSAPSANSISQNNTSNSSTGISNNAASVAPVQNTTPAPAPSSEPQYELSGHDEMSDIVFN